MPTLELSRDEIVAQIDAVARHRGYLDAADLLRRWRVGELDDPGPVADALVLADLLDTDDPLLNDAG
jgi:hypothetical protein